MRKREGFRCTLVGGSWPGEAAGRASSAVGLGSTFGFLAGPELKVRAKQ